MQHDDHFVNYGPIYSKTDDKAGYAMGRGYLVIDKSLPRWQRWLRNHDVDSQSIAYSDKRPSKESAAQFLMISLFCFSLVKISISIKLTMDFKCTVLTQLAASS